MAAIQFTCPQCGATAQAAAFLAGQNVLCPGCGAVLIVPRESMLVVQTPVVPAPEGDRGQVIGDRGQGTGDSLTSTSPTTGPATSTPVQRPILVAPTQATLAAPVVAPSSESTIRRLSSAERESRRARRNILLCAFGIAFLIIALAVLLKIVQR